MLRAHGVRRVVDVRSIPRSRHNPQFNRESLARHLRAAIARRGAWLVECRCSYTLWRALHYEA